MTSNFKINVKVPASYIFLVSGAPMPAGAVDASPIEIGMDLNIDITAAEIVSNAKTYVETLRNALPMIVNAINGKFGGAPSEFPSIFSTKQ